MTIFHHKGIRGFILYPLRIKPLSAYEPESNMGPNRFKNLQMAMRAMKKYIEQALLRTSPKRELPEEEEKDAKNNEDQTVPQFEESPRQKKDLAKELPSALPALGESTSQRVASIEKKGPKVLIIPGPDEGQKKAVFFFLKKLGLEPLLVEGADSQETDLSEKYEMYTEAAFAITLLTRKDMAFPRGKPEKPKPRPTKEVIYDLGFLMGLPGCVLYEEGLDLRFECKGNSLIPYDAGGLWMLLLARRIKMAKVKADLNKALG